MGYYQSQSQQTEKRINITNTKCDVFKVEIISSSPKAQNFTLILWKQMGIIFLFFCIKKNIATVITSNHCNRKDLCLRATTLPCALCV